MTDTSRERCEEVAHAILARYPAGSSDTIYREVSDLITALCERVTECERCSDTFPCERLTAMARAHTAEAKARRAAEADLAEALEVVRKCRSKFNVAISCLNAEGTPSAIEQAKDAKGGVNLCNAFLAKHGAQGNG